MRQETQNEKITVYKKPKNINLGMILFGLIFVYIVICVFLSFTEKHVSGYVVTEGSLSTNMVYRGIALREEIPVHASGAGYVNFYVKEGERVAVSNLIYTLDETGKLNDLYSSQSDELSLSETDLYNLKTQLVDFSHGFETNNFSAVYDFKNNMSNTVLKLSGNTLLNDIDSLSNETGVVINKIYADRSGIVTYWTDGFEEVRERQLTKDSLNESKYMKSFIVDNDLLDADSVAYKLITSENWSVYIPYDYEQGQALVQEEEGYVKVRFIKNQMEAWAEISMLKTDSGDSFMKLKFNHSMEMFSNDRFLDVELMVNDETGLKVPNSAIVEKNFFIVPSKFLTKDKHGNTAVLRRSYLEDGNPSSEIVSTSIYAETDDEVYIDMTTLRSGDILLLTDSESEESFTLGKQGSLIGVYNINKGYADFKQIQILSQNEEYSIIQSNTRYGLIVYDYIVLDASTVSNDEILYE